MAAVDERSFALGVLWGALGTLLLLGIGNEVSRRWPALGQKLQCTRKRNEEQTDND